MRPVIMVDMDGVLSDLDKCLAEFTGDPNPGVDRTKMFTKYLPAYVEGNMFYEQDPMPMARYLVKALIKLNKAGKCDIAIATSGGKFYHPVSEVCLQKKQHIEDKFPELADFPFCLTTSGADKSFLASPRHFLIDDYAKNIKKFIEAGGYGIVYHEDNIEEIIKEVEGFVESFD